MRLTFRTPGPVQPTRHRDASLLASAFAGVLLASCHAAGVVPAAGQNGTPVCGYRIVNTYPHDPTAYTQGLIYRDGFLYESTGLHGRSTLRKVRLETGEVMQQVSVDRQYFAEGLTDWGTRLIQLTWQSNVGFVYDLETFALQRTFSYRGEGWGLTHDGAHLILSDGSEHLRFLDPESFGEVRTVRVTDDGAPVRHLNELEYVGGEVYANVWYDDRIARISPASGRVTAWIDLTGILPGRHRLQHDAVLNGIAYDAGGDRLFVTGKLWPSLFEIEVGACR